MKYFLDSNTVSYLYNPDSPFFDILHEHLANLPEESQVTVPILVIYEQWYGYSNAPEEKSPIVYQRIQDICSDFPIHGL